MLNHHLWQFVHRKQNVCIFQIYTCVSKNSYYSTIPMHVYGWMEGESPVKGTEMLLPKFSVISTSLQTEIPTSQGSTCSIPWTRTKKPLPPKHSLPPIWRSQPLVWLDGFRLLQKWYMLTGKAKVGWSTEKVLVVWLFLYWVLFVSCTSHQQCSQN